MKSQIYITNLKELWLIKFELLVMQINLLKAKFDHFCLEI